MSLVSWFPLNGDAIDRINGNILENPGSAAFANNDVFGKSLYSSSTTGFIYPASVANNIFNTNYFSISFWIYVPSSASGAQIIVGNDNTTQPGGNLTCRRFSLYQYPTKNDLHYSMQNDASFYKGGILTGVLPDNTWTHVCFTYDGSDAIKIYINGVLNHTATVSTSITAASLNYRTYAFWQSPLRHLSDLRFYNHCLSAKEVNELSLGLLLHYSFNDLNTSTVYNNPIAKSSLSSIAYDDNYSRYTLVSKYGSGVSSTWGSGPCLNYLLVPYGYTYRISMDVYVPTAHTFQVDVNNRTADGSTNWSGNDNDLTSSRVVSTGITAGKWSHIYWGSTNAHASNTNKVNLQAYDTLGLKTSGDSAATTWYIKNIKFELSKTTFAEGFKPIVQDEMIYDESGFNYNGSIMGTIYKSNTKNLHATNWIGNSANAIYNTAFPKLQILTYSAWIRTTSTRSGDQIIMGNGRDYSNNNENGFHLYVNGGYACVKAGNGSAQPGVTGSTINDGMFHMITGTYDGTTIRLYIDGVLSNTSTLSGPLKWGGLSTYAFVVGKMAHVYNNTNYYFPFDGDIADVRVYHTCLSADDILSLYQVKKSISKTGELFINTITEDDNNSLSVTPYGIQKAQKFNEIITLSDGSMWLQLMHHDLLEQATGNRFTSGNDVRNKNVYIDENRWSCFPLINTCDHGDIYEFLVIQQTSKAAVPTRHRWSQTINPYNATFNTTKHASITPIENIASNYGGMYPGIDTLTAWIFNNNVNGNWFGCGNVNPWNNGLPGYNGLAVRGVQDVFIRVYSTNHSERKNNIIATKEIKNM